MARRGNGLTAQAYMPLADLAPESADTILDALGSAGVAAYVTPASPGLAAFGHGQPADRLYVDSAARGRAEAVLMDRLPVPHEAGGEAARPPDEPDRPADEPDQPPDEDTMWREIVEGFDTDRRDDPPWPEREDLDDPDRRITTARVIRPAEPARGESDATSDAGSEAGSDAGASSPEDEGHFIPPPPPPLPQTDAATKFSWLALAGGPAYLLATALTGWDVPGWAAFLAVAAFVGGFVSLVMRMGDRNHDGPDDGAVV